MSTGAFNPNHLPASPATVSAETAQTRRKFSQRFLGRRAVAGAGETPAQPTVVLQPPPAEGIRANYELWACLSPERQKRAQRTTAELAELFSLPTEQFRLVASKDSSDKDIVTVIYGGKAVDLGDRSWNNIFNKNNFRKFVKLEIDVKLKRAIPLIRHERVKDEEKFRTDSRQLTWGAYEALVKDARANGFPLPDTEPNFGADGTEGSKVWLTGEPATSEWAPYAYVNDWGNADRGNYHRTRSDPSISFRPAAII